MKLEDLIEKEVFADVDTLNVQQLAKLHKKTPICIKKQLEIGIRVEFEHTKERKAASEIARDHLKEDPFYYQKLKAMEQDD